MDAEKNIPTEECAVPQPESDAVADVAEAMQEMAAVIEQSEANRSNSPAPIESMETEVDPDEEDDAWTEEEIDAYYKKRTKRKRIFRGALRFYTILFGSVLAVLILLCCLMTPLRTLLSQYETSQYQTTADEIYDLLFADPDWALLYDMAGIKSTEFEGRSQFVTYMTQKVAGRPLECVEVSTGLSPHRRYSIRLEGEEIASFTMVPLDDGVSTFQRWTFGEVEVYFTRQESVTVTIIPGYTVYINGVPLDESYTTLKVYTAAEEYLPEGIHGFRYEQQHISGLLVQPKIDVLDEYNNPVPLSLDFETGIYTVPIANTPPITTVKTDVVLEAIQAEALFSIRAIPVTDLREFFTAGSQAYTAISTADPVVTSYKTYKFIEKKTVVDNYYCYSDNFFTARATVQLEVTSKKGKKTTYTTTATYFFTPNNTGNYMATQRFEGDLQELIVTVPIRYAMSDQDVDPITEWVRADDTVITPPAIDGTVAYWARPEADGTLTPVLIAQEDGTFTIAEGQTLQSMTLVPVLLTLTPNE